MYNEEIGCLDVRQSSHVFLRIIWINNTVVVAIVALMLQVRPTQYLLRSIIPAKYVRF